MCGIFGFSFKDDALVQEMAEALRHRGPDDNGAFSDGRATLGHRRLSIIDLSSAGHQPMANKNQNVWITYNGEIYNFKELREDLKKIGHIFLSQTDTEVILKGYEEWGEGVFGKLRGMWALALYDVAKNKLMLSRDFFGIKPLYYYFEGGRLAFASEIKPLKIFFKKMNISNSFSDLGLSAYFVLGYAPQPFTVFEKIKKIRPGEIATFDLKNNKMASKNLNWDKETATAPSQISAPNDFEKVMLESVRRHLIADVPVGLFLSGGADSALLALLIKKLGHSMKTFTVRLPGKRDADFARKIADFAGLNHNEISLGEADFEEMYERLFRELDEPIADTALFPLLLVSKAASSHVKVVMTGEGGDELFWGYERYQNFGALSRVGKTYPHFFKKPESVFYLKYLKPLLRRARLAYFNYKKDLPGAYLEHAAIDSDFARREKIYGHFSKFGLKNENLEPGFFDEKFYLPDNLLKKTDFATMSCSLEGRVPFLDSAVYTFAKNLEARYKISGGVGKKIVKDYLAANLPPDLIFRQKEGFSLNPQIYIFKNHSREVRGAVEYLESLDLGLISKPALRKMLQNKTYFEFVLNKFPQTIFSWLAFYKVCKS